MNKQFLKELIAWIESATIEDLHDKRDTLSEKIESGRYEASELKLVVRVIDEEVLTRICLLKLEN